MPEISLNISDHDLIDGCKRRSRKHEEFFFKKYYGYVMGISLSYAKTKDLAEEIVHDSFLKFFDSVQKFEVFPLIKPWLRRVTVNTAIDYYRKNLKFISHVEADGQTPVFDELYAIDQLAYEEILKIVFLLPEDYRMVFNLYEIEGYSHKEIAERLSITESSSRVYLTRAKSRLRHLIHSYSKEYAGR